MSHSYGETRTPTLWLAEDKEFPSVARTESDGSHRSLHTEFENDLKTYSSATDTVWTENDKN
jgi:hypothetical protein